MDFNHLPKKKRGVYEKEFTLQHVLQNLQGYRLATGAVDQCQVNEKRRIHGEDAGRVYGALITGAGNYSSEQETQDACGREAKGRKRRRRRKRKKHSSVLAADNCEKLQLEKTNASSDRSKDSQVTEGASSQDVATGSLGMLAAYRDSSDESSEEDTHEQGQKRLPIPASIESMFQERQSETQDTAEKNESFVFATSVGESSHLGFFGEEESDEEEACETKSVPGSSAEIKQGIVGHSHGVTKRWSEEKAQWIFGDSELTSYTCWKCSNVGHLPKDCTVAVSHGQVAGSKVKVPRSLQALYATCRELRSKKEQHCADCGVHSNLACCLDCRSVLCDGKGHLVSHLLEHPSHNTLFSFKLGRLLKCCQPSCEVVSVYDLLVCSHCLGKAFSQHYSMINAVWSAAGLRKIPNALCCEEHFQWHRMNCPNVCEEAFITEEKLHLHNSSSGLLSEFYF